MTNKERVDIYKDERYLILICKDHWKGLAVQVCRFGVKSIATGTNALAEERVPYVTWSQIIPTFTQPAVGVVKPRDPNEFRQEVLSAIAVAHAKLKELQQLDAMMDGILMDQASKLESEAPKVV